MNQLLSGGEPGMTHRTTSSSNLSLSYRLYMHQVAIYKNLAICAELNALQQSAQL
jgi:hypothetical protein